jgi:hypothetical protein
MKRLTITCFLLSLYVTPLVAAPAPQSSRQTSGESKCNVGFKECQESLNDFKDAREFMRLKATLLADLDRLEKSKAIKPKIAPAYDAVVNRPISGNGIIYSTTGGPYTKPSVQAAGAAQPLPMESAAGTPSYKRMP